MPGPIRILRRENNSAKTVPILDRNLRIKLWSDCSRGTAKMGMIFAITI
jgi:hypothetical protein